MHAKVTTMYTLVNNQASDTVLLLLPSIGTVHHVIRTVHHSTCYTVRTGSAGGLFPLSPPQTVLLQDFDSYQVTEQ